MNNKISIIIPAYNVEKYIYFTIESIVSNIDYSSSELEVIVVIDGSQDNSINEIRRAQQDFSKYDIKYYEQTNQGVSVARNNGLLKATGDFVWFVDGDDAIAVNSISIILKTLNNHSVDIDLLYTGSCVSDILLYEDNSIARHFYTKVEESQSVILDAIELLSLRYPKGHTLFIWRREFLIYNNLKYPEGITFNEDFTLLFCSLSLANKAIYNPSFKFYIARENPDSVSRQKRDVNFYKRYIDTKVRIIGLLTNEKVKNDLCYSKKIYSDIYYNFYVENTLKVIFGTKLPYSYKLEKLHKINELGVTIKRAVNPLLRHKILYRFGYIIMNIYLKSKNIIRK